MVRFQLVEIESDPDSPQRSATTQPQTVASLRLTADTELRHPTGETALRRIATATATTARERERDARIQALMARHVQSRQQEQLQATRSDEGEDGSASTANDATDGQQQPNAEEGGAAGQRVPDVGSSSGVAIKVPSTKVPPKLSDKEQRKQVNRANRQLLATVLVEASCGDTPRSNHHRQRKRPHGGGGHVPTHRNGHRRLDSGHK